MTYPHLASSSHYIFLCSLPATLTFPLFLKHTKLQAHSQFRSLQLLLFLLPQSFTWLALPFHSGLRSSVIYPVMPSLTILVSLQPSYHITLPYLLHNTLHPVKLSWLLTYELFTVYLPPLEHKHHESRGFIPCLPLYPQHQKQCHILAVVKLMNK